MSIQGNLATIKNLVVTVHDAELKAELLAPLVDANNAAIDLQERVGQLQEENAKLKAERDARDDVAQMQKNLFYVRHAYWRRDEEGCSAYCQACWDSKQKLLRLTRAANEFGMCMSCKSKYPRVYDGSRPSEGDEATPGGPANPPIPTTRKPSRRQMFRNI